VVTARIVVFPRVTITGTCVACGSQRLVPHLHVAGDMGSDGLIPTTDQYGTALADIVRCPACGHMQLSPMPADAVLEQAYTDAASDDYVQEAAGQRETARRALERIERHAARTERLLDLGCWVGFLLAEARTRGWEPTGVEPSTFASAFARDEFGLDVRTEDLFTADLPTDHYDAVVLGDVIEHLPRPGEALDRIAALLRDGGVAWFALPDAGSRIARTMGKRWWSVLPTHVQYFTRTSISTLLRTHGWDVLEIDTTPKAFSVRYYLERLEGYSPAVSRAAVGAATRLGAADRMWAPDFRDRMQVIARPR
jgi:SAM-dependent methyltransferase